MDDVEARLRQTLGERLAPVVADPGRALATVRRARRSRVLRGNSTGLAGVLVAGAASFAVERGVDDGPPPAKKPPPTATFAVSFPGGDGGTVVVDVPKGQVCLDLFGDAPVYAAHLHYAPEGPDPSVAEFALSFETYRDPHCVSVPTDDAKRIVAEPQTHYLDAHRDFGRPESPLRHVDLAPEELPDVVKIVCTEGGAVAVTPEAQPRRDGVHLRLYNQTDLKVFNATSPGSGGSWGGRISREQGTDYGHNIPPGPHSLGCFRSNRTIPYDQPEHPWYAHFRIVDPHGLWIEPGLDCPEDRRRQEVPTNLRVRSFLDPPDMQSLIREFVPGVRSDDSFTRVTYPESAAKLEHLTLVRGGQRVAHFLLSSEDDPAEKERFVWSLMPFVCPGVEIGTRRG